MTTVDFTSDAVHVFAVGFWEIESFHLHRPCSLATVQILKALLDAGRKVVFTAFHNDNPGRVPIELIRIQPSNGAGEGVVHFDCVRDECPAQGVIDLSTQEIVLGFPGVPF